MTALASLGALRLRALALLLVVFVAGGFAGAGLARLHAPRWPHPPPPGAGPYSQLGLTADQEARAQQVFEKHRAELDAILHETMPRVRAVQDTIDAEMRSVLTPDQIRRLDELKANAPPPPPGMPGMGPPPGLPPPPPPAR
jgi:Spy/CpxP family protein refolding chaperone